MNDIYKLEKEEIWFVLKCYNDYIIDFYETQEDYNSVPVCISEFYNNEYMEFYQYFLDLLYNDLSYIILDSENNINEDFYMWEKGTNINIIKNWFKKRKEN